VVVGDVCGKGAEAAAVTALARDTIRAVAMARSSPADVLRRVNATLLGQRTGRFITVACARLDLRGDAVEATVACGGHPLPRVLRTGGAVEPLGTHGTLLGVLDEVRIADAGTRLAAGDALILSTDGLTAERLDAAAADARGGSAQAIADRLAAAVDGPLRDDLALLAVRVPQPLL
jgi:serine phosphatase RsbU (regulator of sigma subunit)